MEHGAPFECMIPEQQETSACSIEGEWKMSKHQFDIQPVGRWYGASAAIKRPKVNSSFICLPPASQDAFSFLILILNESYYTWLYLQATDMI